MSKVLNINDYSPKNNKLRTKADVVTIDKLLESDDKKLEMFGRRMYNNQTKLEFENKLNKILDNDK